MNKKIATFVVAMVLLLGVTLGITFALMTAETKTITNTFVAGGFGNLHLYELDENGDAVEASGQTLDHYTMYPGAEIEKTAYVTFSFTGSKKTDYYIYIKVDAPNWTDEDQDGSFVNGPLSFSLDGWESLYQFDEEDELYHNDDGDNLKGYYFKKITAGVNVDDATGNIISEGKVVVDPSATETDLENLVGEAAAITFSAYAVMSTGANTENALTLFADASFVTKITTGDQE